MWSAAGLLGCKALSCTRRRQSLAAFAGASMRPAPVGTVVHDISGNPLRFDGAQRAIRGDMEWVHALSAEDRRVVTAVTAPLLWRYGYRWRRPT